MALLSSRIRRRKYGKEGTGANMSILVSPEPLSCHVHTGPFDPAMRRQYDLHPKEPNRRPMHARPDDHRRSTKARLHQVRLVILFFLF
jgi:hypothetical protein